MRLVLFVIVSAVLAACGNSPEQPTVGGTTVAHQADTETVTPLELDSVTVTTHERLMQLARERNLSERPMGEVIQTFAEALLGYPYAEHMLDQHDEETLVVSLAGFDCVLFNEAVIALAQAVRAEAYDLDAFARNVESLRYRDGRMEDYCSRLHFFSDWLRDNDRRGNIRLITSELSAAEPFEKRIDFMTEHRDAYRQLSDDEQFVCIGEVQRDLSRVAFTYVPQGRIQEVYGELEPGDVLALTTSVGGLDVAHTGFVYKDASGRVGLIHASTTGEVKIDRDLASYVRGIRIQNGMMVARVQDKPAS